MWISGWWNLSICLFQIIRLMWSFQTAWLIYLRINNKYILKLIVCSNLEEGLPSRMWFLWKTIPKSIRDNFDNISGCVAGALLKEKIISNSEQTGFKEISINIKEESKEFIKDWFPGTNMENYVRSAEICGIKKQKGKNKWRNYCPITKALSDGNRLRVVVSLMEHEELCVCQITEMLKLATATVSRHMSVLSERPACFKQERRALGCITGLPDHSQNSSGNGSRYL